MPEPTRAPQSSNDQSSLLSTVLGVPSQLWHSVKEDLAPPTNPQLQRVGPAIGQALSSIPEGFVNSLAEAGRYATGNAPDPLAVGDIEEPKGSEQVAMNTALSMLGGSAVPGAARLAAGGRLPVEHGVTPMFIGSGGTRLPRRYSDRLDRAHSMEQSPLLHDAKDITRETGWSRDPTSSQWLYEINDTQARLDLSRLSSPDKGFGDHMQDFIQSRGGKTDAKTFSGAQKYATAQLTAARQAKPVTLDQVLHHPQLFEAVPELKEVKVSYAAMDPSLTGAYNSEANTIKLNKNYEPESAKYIQPGRQRDAFVAAEQMRTMLHEIQHAIQKRHRLPRGASSDMAFTDYRTLPLTLDKKGTPGWKLAQQELDRRTRLAQDPHLMTQDEFISSGKHGRTFKTPGAEDEAYEVYKNSHRGRQLTATELRDLRNEVATDWYRRQAGEALARLTENRWGLSARERRRDQPFDPASHEMSTGYSPADLYDRR